MKKNLIKWGGVFSFLAFSLGSKADFSFYSSPTPAIISTQINEEIASKLAADAKFTQLIDLISNTESKIKMLSLDDKKLFKKYAEEKDIVQLSRLYSKSGIDYKTTFSEKLTLINELEKKYELNKRSDKKDIIKFALVKAKSPFAECLMGLMMGGLACAAFPDEQYYICIMAVEALYLSCIFVLD